MVTQERVVVHGRAFILLCRGPLPTGRYEIVVWEGRRLPWRRPYLHAPIRGRDAEEARDRALEVLHTYVGLDRFRLMVERIVRRAAPGAEVEVGEDARDVLVSLRGAYALDVPLAVARREVLDRNADLERLRGLIRAHIDAYARRR
jgi:hypothetical protein